MNRSDIGPYSIVPEWILDACSPTAVKLFALLGRYANAENDAWPSRRTLASRMKLSTDTVDRAIQELITAGAAEKRTQSLDGQPQPNLIRLLHTSPGVSAPMPRGMGTGAEGGMGTGAEQTRASIERRYSKSSLSLSGERVATSRDASRKNAKGRPARFEDVVPEFLARGSTADHAEQFWHFYESKGWKVGKTPMVKWKAAVAGWIARNKTAPAPVAEPVEPVIDFGAR